VKGEWNGDVDLGDGVLQELRQDYIERKKLVTLPHPKERSTWIEHIEKHIEQLHQDIALLEQMYAKACKSYTIKKNPSTERILILHILYVYVFNYRPINYSPCKASILKFINFSELATHSTDYGLKSCVLAPGLSIHGRV